jgi:hypothetical protein
MRGSDLGAVSVTLLAALACGDGPASSGPNAEVVQWQVEEVLRIGSATDAEQALVAVGEVAVGPDDALYVVQTDDDQIRVYGVDGRLQRTIGRTGEGPGEFGSIGGLGFRGDTLYVADRSPSRVTHFTLDGAVLATEPWQGHTVPFEAGAFLTSAPQVLLPDGSGLVSPGMMVRGSTVAGAAGPQVRTQPWMMFFARREPALLDTIVHVTRTMVSNAIPTAGGRTARLACPFPAWPLVYLMEDGSGVVVVDRTPAAAVEPSTFPVTVYAPSGDTLFSVSVPYDPVPVGDEQIAEHVSAEVEVLSARYDGAGPSAAEVESAIRGMDCIPRALPPVLMAVPAQDGTIWIKREPVPGEVDTRWDVVAREGWIGRVRLPAEEDVAAAARDVLVTRELDALDVPYLTRYRLVRR